MNCNDLHALIEDYVDGQLELGEAAAVKEHIACCERCHDQQYIHKTYREQMRSFKAPTLASGSSAQLLRRARKLGEQTQYRKNYSFIYGFAVASVLAFAIMIGVNSFTTEKPTTAMVGVFDWEREISLVINVPNDMEDAMLVLNLPSDITIQGLEHLSKIEWLINLKKGSNTITLPINIEPYAHYAEQIHLAASIIHKNDKKDFTLDLNLSTSHNKNTKKG